jgi:hypothetical protein
LSGLVASAPSSSGVTPKKGVSFICPYGYQPGQEICHPKAYISVLQRRLKRPVCPKPYQISVSRKMCVKLHEFFADSGGLWQDGH